MKKVLLVEVFPGLQIDNSLKMTIRKYKVGVDKGEIHSFNRIGELMHKADSIENFSIKESFSKDYIWKIGDKINVFEFGETILIQDPQHTYTRGDMVFNLMKTDSNMYLVNESNELFSGKEDIFAYLESCLETEYFKESNQKDKIKFIEDIEKKFLNI